MADIGILAPFILTWEGGFSDHPSDPGGATNKGVTISTWMKCGYDKNGDGITDTEDLKMLTDEEAVNVVMKPCYWDRWKAGRIRSQSIANICVDWVWGSGANGITGVQRLLGVKVDGVVGDCTLSALNAREPRALFDEIKEARARFFERLCIRKPELKVFMKGWMRRLNSINYGSLTYGRKEHKFADV